MALTSEQRSAINKANAAKSTGPRTQAGKERSRANAMTHGITAEILCLPTETDEAIEAHMTAWKDTLEPANYQEDMLAQQAMIASLRLNRLARAENATLCVQISESDAQWERAEDLKRVAMVKLLQTDPAVARIELKSFGPGVAWLLSQWVQIQLAFQKVGFLNNLDLIKLALRLRGYDPDRLAEDQSQGFDFAVQAIASTPNAHEQPELVDFLVRQPHPCYYGRNGTSLYGMEQARAMVEKVINDEIAALEGDLAYFRPLAAQARSAAREQALILHDTPQAKLFLRYTRAAESALEKAVKTLAKVQADRKKVERKTEEDDDIPVSRNEPKSEPANPDFTETILDLSDAKPVVMGFAVGKPPQSAVA